MNVYIYIYIYVYMHSFVNHYIIYIYVHTYIRLCVCVSATREEFAIRPEKPQPFEGADWNRHTHNQSCRQAAEAVSWQYRG